MDIHFFRYSLFSVNELTTQKILDAQKPRILKEIRDIEARERMFKDLSIDEEDKFQAPLLENHEQNGRTSYVHLAKAESPILRTQWNGGG